MKKRKKNDDVFDVDRQLEGMHEKVSNILESYPGVVYMPCYYRSTPPRIFIRENSVRVIVRQEEPILNPKGRCYDLAEAGYHNLGEGIFYIAYEFPPGRRFELEMEGCLMEKKLEPGDLGRELWELCASRGIYAVLPLLKLKRVAAAGKGGVTLRIKKLDPEISLPSYAHEDDAGLDLSSADELVLEPGQRSMVSTGFAMALPRGYAAFVQPRGGRAARHGISIVNPPGLIDCHYRGEVKVILINLGR